MPSHHFNVHIPTFTVYSCGVITRSAEDHTYFTTLLRTLHNLGVDASLGQP